MGLSPTMEIAALVLTFLVHVLGGAVLIWNLMGAQGERPSWRDWWPRDDDGGPEPAGPSPVPSGDGMPLLPDAVPASVRIREGERLADHRTRPTRRPLHPAVPAEPPRVPAERD